MGKDVKTMIIPILKATEAEYTRDNYADALEEAFDNLTRKYAGLAVQAKQVSSQFVTGVDVANKERFYRSIDAVVGVNLSTVVGDEGIAAGLKTTVNNNVKLITSIKDDYLKRVEQIVYQGTIEGNTSGSMIKELQRATRIEDNRARLIARDQTAKLNGMLTGARSLNLGIEEYIWVTSSDERVRDSHVANNGKKFRWAEPPATGHPGQDIQCRCTAQSIIAVAAPEVAIIQPFER